MVSTHSRPKAAGFLLVWAWVFGVFQHTAARRRLDKAAMLKAENPLFQHTAARRRLGLADGDLIEVTEAFQHTAARRRLGHTADTFAQLVGFNTQPPEGGWMSASTELDRYIVSTHSRPKAAGTAPAHPIQCWPLFQHTAARRRLDIKKDDTVTDALFQHTAARRRLASLQALFTQNCVFQHTAARRRLAMFSVLFCG